MPKFEITGPYNIPVVKNAGGRHIDEHGLKAFWEESGCKDARGCYIFGIRSGGGILPYYVGKATNSFGSESFTDEKLKKYHRVLTKFKIGVPVMFFVWLNQSRGVPNRSAIGELEDLLIGIAYSRNPDLENVHGIKKSDIIIGGVLRSRGKPTHAAKKFRSMMAM